MKKLLFYISLSLFIASCNNNKERKVVEQKYPDGSPKVERYYKGDTANKEMTKEITYYPNKQEQMEGTYKDNKRNGNWVYYYKNGKKWSEGSFVDGLDDGKRTGYFENGQKRFEGYYNRGAKTGIWKFYDEKGKQIKEIDFDKADTTKVK